MKNVRKYFSFSIRDLLAALLILVIASAVCFVLRMIDENASYAPMIFILAVFLISEKTSGYLFGIVSSFAGVLLVNFIFTYPYLKFNFTLSGYPVTIICMLAVSFATSTLTTKLKLQENIKLEAQREKTRSNLLRAVSHDLRTPLTSILGASSAMIENDEYITKEERISLLKSMKEDSQWLISMVENLLSVTRIDSETAAKITKQPELAEEIASDSVAKFKKRFPDANVSVSVPDEMLLIPMDAILIEQVIVNLLENAAIHAIGATMIKFTVTAGDKCAVFTVSDNGAGIADDVLPKILDGYFCSRSENRSDAKRNMGIGLSVCRTIVSAHNGEMSAENLSGGGACFRFTLPF
ncbi:MAG: DUF4118 domain-containing protein [Oscillospiraceae bacterium]|nr:DUF4118 domain-containing protein [Oscillospiraceae bacterium]